MTSKGKITQIITASNCFAIFAYDKQDKANRPKGLPYNDTKNIAVQIETWALLTLPNGDTEIEGVILDGCGHLKFASEFPSFVGYSNEKHERDLEFEEATQRYLKSITDK